MATKARKKKRKKSGKGGGGGGGGGGVMMSLRTGFKNVTHRAAGRGGAPSKTSRIVNAVLTAAVLVVLAWVLLRRFHVI